MLVTHLWMSLEKSITFPNIVKKIAKKKVLSLSTLAKTHIINMVLENPKIWKETKEKRVLSKDLTDYINNDYKRIFFMDINNAIGIFDLIGHTRPIVAIHIDSKYHFAITGSLDKTARIWNLKEKICVKTLEHENNISNVFIDIEYRIIVTIENSTIVNFWEFDNINKQQVFKSDEKVILIGLVVLDRTKKLVLRTKENLCIFDPATLQFNEKIRCYSLTLYSANCICRDGANNSIILSHNGKKTIFKNFRDKINDINILGINGNCVVLSCTNNSIDIWAMKNLTTIVGTNIGKPLIIKYSENGTFIVMTKFSTESFKFFRLTVRINEEKKMVYNLKQIAHIVLPPLINGEYDILDIYDWYNINDTTIIARMYNERVNYLFWLMIKIPNDSKNAPTVHFSLINPLMVDGTFATILVDNLSDVLRLLNGIARPTMHIGQNPIVYNFNQQCFYLATYYQGGECRIHQLCCSSSLENEILLKKIEEHIISGTIMDYDEWYDKLLMNTDKCILTLVFYKHMHILKEYIIKHQFEEKSQKEFGKPFEKLDFKEISRLFGYEYHRICNSKSK